MNPNSNTVTKGSEKIPIPFSSTPETHVRFVWETYASVSQCSQVYIVAYGRGGVLAKHLISTQMTLCNKLAALAFIESSHRVLNTDSEAVRNLIGTRAINWQRSKEPPGTQVLYHRETNQREIVSHIVSLAARLCPIRMFAFVSWGPRGRSNKFQHGMDNCCEYADGVCVF